VAKDDQKKKVVQAEGGATKVGAQIASGQPTAVVVKREIFIFSQ
jgi:hypothetical protein